MPSPRPAAIRALCLAAVVLLSRAPASAGAGPASTLSQIPLPGGLPAALAVVDDRTAPDRALFLLEFIRRTHDTLIDAKDSTRGGSLRALLAHLDSNPEGTDLLPLPLTPEIWIDVVFGGASRRETLVADILRSRNASLLYAGLLALDDETRTWLAGEPGLLSEIGARHAAAFAAVAPGLRVARGGARGPGGDDAQPVWEALTGRAANRPVDFVRALLAERDGRLAYFAGALAQLDAGQLSAALRLGSAAADRVTAARRLLTPFEQVAPGWRIADRAFWRPALDPALFIADLPRTPDGRPVVRGSRAFWQAVLAQGESALAGAANRSGDDEPADVVWLCERVFEQPADHRRRYQMALYASRLLEAAAGPPTRDTIVAVRASVALPALSAALERAGIVDAAVIATAVRRAEGLLAVDDTDDAARALAQFQGALVVLTHAALRGSLTPAQAADAIRQLSAIDPGPRGRYNGGIAQWLAVWARTLRRNWQAGPVGMGGPSDAAENGGHDDTAALERAVLRLVAGPPPRSPMTVDWEGMRYRVDLAAGELARLSRFLGEHPRPYLSVAEQLAMAADALGGDTPLRASALQQLKTDLDAAAKEVRLTDEHEWEEPRLPARYREAVAQLERVAPSNAAAAASRAAATLRTLADDLVGVALTEITYALAMGHADSIPIPIEEAASRHDFGLTASGTRRRTAWQLGVAGSDSRRGWHVTGALLGLDARLAEFALRRLTNRPPRRPTLNDEDRRVFIETAAVFNPGALHDDDAAFILAALQRGRARVAAAANVDDVASLADALPLDAARRTLLLWSAAHDRGRVAPSFSPLELLWLGADPAAPAPPLHAWGVSADPRNGCLCPQMINRRPWDSLAGRWTWGTVASGFPDLNLRLAEILAELKMPAVLVGPVLKSATLELVNTAPSRGPDDRRALVEFVQSLTPVRVADFLAVLTTDGPLVPVDGMTPASTMAGVR